MAESILGKLGFRRASGVDEAGWGRTLAVAVVAFIYFLPVLFIIFTAFKPQGDALLVPPTLSPTSLFGLIPDHFVFKPTLENFGSVFSRSMTPDGAPEATGFDRYFFNSIFIASASVLLALVIGTLAAFGFSRYPLKGNDTYLFIILTTRMHLVGLLGPVGSRRQFDLGRFAALHLPMRPQPLYDHRAIVGGVRVNRSAPVAWDFQQRSRGALGPFAPQRSEALRLVWRLGDIGDLVGRKIAVLKGESLAGDHEHGPRRAAAAPHRRH